VTDVPRRDPLINEAVEILDNHFKRNRYDYSEAFNTLNSDENEFIDAELAKCLANPRYYLENYHVIKTEDQGFKTLFPFWDSQEIFYNEIMDMVRAGLPVKVLVLKARQLGLSTISEGLIFHRTIFHETINSLIVAQDPGQAGYLFDMFTRAYDNLPWWMRPEKLFRSKGKYMVFATEVPGRTGLNSEIFVEAANKLTGVSVGKTIRAAHLSELSAWNDPKTLTEQIFPTMNAKDELAIMESTARGRQGFWYDFWRSAINQWGNGTWEWKPIFIEWFRCSVSTLERKKGQELRDTDGKYSKKVDEKFQLTPDESAFRDKVQKITPDKFYISDEMFYWKRAKITETIASTGDAYSFYQEYPSNWMEAFQATGICAFPKPLLQRIMDTSCVDPLWVGELEYVHGSATPIRPLLTDVAEAKEKDKGWEIPSAEGYGGRLRVWEKPEGGESYYIGADVAYGVEGGDYSCAQVIRIGHGGAPDVQVAEWHGWINPTPYGDLLAGLGYWYNQAEIAVEVDGVGMKTYIQISRIIEYPNLFRWKHYDRVKNAFSDLMGWVTNQKTRSLIITQLRERLMENTVSLYSYELLDEMMDFSQDEDGGRFEGQNTNDDRVFAMMIALWCAHDSDFGQSAASSPAPIGASGYFVLDNMGRVVEKCHRKSEDGRSLPVSREEAMSYLNFIDNTGNYRRNAGWSIRRQVTRRDFSNTDFSPVHDRPGPRATMHYVMGIPAEQIRLDNIVENNVNRGEDDWRNY
jgi:hypothetical protein